MPRANLFLSQAIAVLQTRSAFKRPYDERDAWSSTYLPLAALLGKPLSETLRGYRELQNDFVYCGTEYAWESGSRNEHVVPMRCLVKHLIAKPELWDGRDGLLKLRRFLCEHLVLARVPKELDDVLKRHEMPNDTWHLPVSPMRTQRAKDMDLWGRYRAVSGLRCHWQTKPHFSRLHT